MKKITLLFLLIAGTTLTSFGQERHELKADSVKVVNGVYEVVDKQAKYPGGIDAMKKYIANSIHYPESALERGVSGKVYSKFVITKKGQITNISIVKGMDDCAECNAEVVRILEEMPKWKPAKVNGKKVDSYFNLPVSFKAM